MHAKQGAEGTLRHAAKVLKLASANLEAYADYVRDDKMGVPEAMTLAAHIISGIHNDAHPHHFVAWAVKALTEE